MQSVILDRPGQLGSNRPGVVAAARGASSSRLGFSLFILVNVLLFTRPAEFFPALAPLHMYEIAMIACLAIYLPQMLAQLQGQLLRTRPITAMVVILLPLVLITSLAHGYVDLCIEYTTAYFKVVLYFLLMMCAVRSPSQLRCFVLWIAVCAIIITVVPVLDHFGKVSFDALHKLTDVRIDPETGKDIRVQRLQSVGIFGDPNDLAQMTGTGVILCFYAALTSPRWWRKLAWAAPVPVMIYAIGLTESRGGLLAIGAGLGMLLLTRFGLRKALIVGAFCLPALAVALGVRSEAFSTEEGSAQSRVRLWSDALEGVKSSPVFGVGAGAMGEFYMDQVAHNTFLHMFGELGMFGGLAFLGAVYVAIWGMVRLWPGKVQVTDPTLRAMRPFLAAAITTYGMGMMSLSRGYEVPTYTLLGMAGIWLVLAQTAPSVPPLQLDRVLLRRVLCLGLAYLVAMHVFVRLSVRWSG